MKSIHILAVSSIIAVAGAAVAARQSSTPTPPSTTKYTIFVYETESEQSKRTDSGEAGKLYWAAYMEFAGKLEQAGVMRPGGCALQPDAQARTVRVRDEKPITTTGAWAVANEKTRLGGYFVIEVSGMEAALDWARQVPSAVSGAVEVRAALPMPESKPAK